MPVKDMGRQVRELDPQGRKTATVPSRTGACLAGLKEQE